MYCFGAAAAELHRNRPQLAKFNQEPPKDLDPLKFIEKPSVEKPVQQFNTESPSYELEFSRDNISKKIEHPKKRILMKTVQLIDGKLDLVAIQRTNFIIENVYANFSEYIKLHDRVP